MFTFQRWNMRMKHSEWKRREKKRATFIIAILINDRAASHELAAWMLEIQTNKQTKQQPHENLSQIYQLENVLHEIITPLKRERET